MLVLSACGTAGTENVPSSTDGRDDARLAIVYNGVQYCDTGIETKPDESSIQNVEMPLMAKGKTMVSSWARPMDGPFSKTALPVCVG